jgi:wyosine [tRNA(Phe)-imidazoG37] synthetase (radical SAM superfamily)
LIWDDKVQQELKDIDVLLPSLDAVSETAFRKLNRPHHALLASAIVQGLISFRQIFAGKIWLEIFLSPGINDQPEELELLRSACEKIKADRIQLNTLDRPGVIKGLSPLPLQKLEEIVQYFLPLPVEIIAKFKSRNKIKSYHKNIEQQIIETIKRRPCTDKDLSEILSIHVNEINKYLSELIDENMVDSQHQERGIFFRAK